MFSPPDLQVVRATDGKELFRLADTPESAPAVLSADGKYLAVCSPPVLRVFRIGDGMEVFAMKDVDRLFSIRFIGPELLSFTHFDQGRMTAQSRNTSSWERDDRFSEDHRFLQAVTRDAKYGLDYDTVDDVPHWSIYDYQSGQQLWEIPRCLLVPTFSEDGREVVGILMTSSAPELARWASADGRERLRMPLTLPDWKSLRVSPDGSYLVGEHYTEDIRLPMTVQKWIGRLGINWNPVLSKAYQFLTFTDCKTGRYQGFVHVGSDMGNHRLLHNSSSLFFGRAGVVTTYEGNEAQFYPWPVERDWKWLICWGIVPSVGAGLLCAVRARNRRRAVVA
jgi:hypothetical protein